MKRLLPSSSQVNLSGSDFDTLLAAYTGTAVNALTPVASNDNCTTGGSSPSGASCVTFTVTQGTVYRLQVNGAGGGKGSVAIAVVFAWHIPSNDDFLSATTTFPTTGTTVNATLEMGEPLAGPGASGSVWYQLLAASNGVAAVCVEAHT
jgi:hypothetical protein